MDASVGAGGFADHQLEGMHRLQFWGFGFGMEGIRPKDKSQDFRISATATTMRFEACGPSSTLLPR